MVFFLKIFNIFHNFSNDYFDLVYRKHGRPQEFFQRGFLFWASCSNSWLRNRKCVASSGVTNKHNYLHPPSQRSAYGPVNRFRDAYSKIF